MRFLAQRTDDAAAQLTLVAAEAAALTPHTGRCQVQALDNSLPRWRYVQQFTASDVIVLPYDPPRYAESTSGIFVESIVFGTMPIVTANTWMAYELSKYQLTDLVLSLDEWRQPDIAARLLSCARQPQLWQRLETMRQHYLHQHGEQAYAAAMRQMWAISNGQRDTAAVQSQEGAQ
ncbi:MAG: hypothetical protein HC837_19375 [Chloroflexaceae bacterium]|nr:hypothetical protein [Chloroflexaceae bacterium]